MDFKNSVLWSGKLYNLLEKFKLEDKFKLDAIIDNNFPQALSKLQSYATCGKIAVCQTNDTANVVNVINQILLADDKTYITNINQDGKIYPPLTSIVLDLSKCLDIYGCESRKDYYIMAISEYELEQYFNAMKFDYLLLGNLFVDQKDFVSLEEKKEKIQRAITFNSKLNLIINADEPMFFQIDEIKNDTTLNKKRNKFFYGFENIEFCDTNKNLNQKNDIIICPNCTCKLDYKKEFYSHIGQYDCACGFRRPHLDLSADVKVFNDYCFVTAYYKEQKMVFRLPFGGINGAYNGLAAIAVALCLGVERKTITSVFENFQNLRAKDEIIEYKNKNIKIKTVTNSTSLSSALRELFANKSTKVIFCLGDFEEDGIDTSWIWDANFNSMACFENKIYVSGNRFDDMALRLKYANVNPSLIVMDGSIKNAIRCCYWDLEKNENMLILTTPSFVDEIYAILKK